MKRIVIVSLVLAGVAAAVPLAGQVVPRLSGGHPAGPALPGTAAQEPGTVSQGPGGGKLSSPAAVPPSVSPAGKTQGTTSAAPALPGPGTASPLPLPPPPGKAAAPEGGKEKSAPRSITSTPPAQATASGPADRLPPRAEPSNTSRRELVIENALVMLIDDNKVPATETGMLTAVHVKEGAMVEKGALLAEIDSRATLAKQRVAQGELAAALAQAENDAEVEVARHAIEVAKADLDANTEIRRTNKAAVSEAEHRKFVFQYQRSLAQEKQAINEKEIARLTATAKQAQLDATTVELELRQIRAPFEGQVVEIMKNVGDWVTAGEPIMHVVGLKRVRVKGFVPADLATHREVLGKPVTITVYSGGQREYTVRGMIGFASPVIEGLGSGRQFRIWAEVDNEESIDPVTGQAAWKIQPGSVARMVIDLSSPTGGVAKGPASASATATGTPRPAAASGLPPKPAGREEGAGERVRSFKPVTDGPAHAGDAPEPAGRQKPDGATSAAAAPTPTAGPPQEATTDQGPSTAGRTDATSEAPPVEPAPAAPPRTARER